ncbi:MAG: hypothetical protein R6X20_15840 [Phycisphaerae bacterium]
MTVRQRKMLIWLLAGALAAPAVAVVVLGLAVPVRVETAQAPATEGAQDEKPSAKSATADAGDRPQRAALAELLRLCRANLRRPLYDADEPAEDAKTGKTAARRAARSPLTLRLIGTVNEPGHSMAMFQKKDGSIALCAQGESVDDAGGAVTVTQVEFEKVTVEYGNRSHELIIPPRKSRPTPARAAPVKKRK